MDNNRINNSLDLTSLDNSQVNDNVVDGRVGQNGSPEHFEKGKKRKLFLVSAGATIVLVICIILAIVFSLKNNSSGISPAELMAMSDSELSDLFYETSRDGLVSDSIKRYRYRALNVDSLEDALEDASEAGEDLLELKLKNETDYYYVVYQKYVSHRNTGDVVFENDYLYLKRPVFNTEDKIINLKFFNNPNKIKEAFDTYLYTRNSDNESFKFLSSEIEENTSTYVYKYYYFEASYGDWGLEDDIRLYEGIVEINRREGGYNLKENMLREVSGKKH